MKERVTMYKYLDNINKPSDLKRLSLIEMDELAKEIRKFLIKSVSKTGGHLASNLGVVELTLALHSVYDTTKDKIVFDVGHQSYVHKLLTGRKEKFSTLRQYEGLSGFPKRKESVHDCFETGHSSTSISAGLGIALGRDFCKDKFKVVSVIGDGALTGGLALEGLNHLGSTNTDMLVILNDNDMSICENVGGLSNSLYNIRMTKAYRKFSKNMINFISSVPVVGVKATNAAVRIKDSLKHMVMPGAFFEEMGIKYFGPVDGHDYKSIVHALKELNNIEGPKILHVLTTKGKGYKYAQDNPSDYHGVSKFDIAKGVISSSQLTYSTVAGNTLNSIFERDSKSVAITAAMISGTGLDILFEKHSKRVIDVGIAEEHAVTLAAGLATSGIKPYFVVYSTFLQRAYDQILHDVALQDLPVTLLIDRAGLVGEDGETHHGVFDIGFLSTIPNLTIMSPRDLVELQDMIEFSHSYNHPLAIRYPRGKAVNLSSHVRDSRLMKWEWIYEEPKIAIVAIGKMVETAIKIRESMALLGIKIAVVNARCIKPMDDLSIQKLSETMDYIFSLEDHVYSGGFSSKLKQKLFDSGYTGKFKSFSLPDEFIEHGNTEILLAKYGLDSNTIHKNIIECIRYNEGYEEIS